MGEVVEFLPQPLCGEAERYSRPGSVAQKKAFFEAHYRKLAAQKAAAALLEQANNNNATAREGEGVIDNVNDNDTVSHNAQTNPNSEMVVQVEQDEKVLNVTSDENNAMVRLTASVETSVTPESVKVEGTEAAEMEEVAVVGNSMEVELQNQLEDLDAQREQNERPSAIVTPILTPLVKVVMLIYLVESFSFDILRS